MDQFRMAVKSVIKNIIPRPVFSLYHLALAVLADAAFGRPSRRMIVIGITGTKGKTTTASYIWSCLSAGGHKAGLVSTAVIRVGEEERVNSSHMTMPGRFSLQRLLARMRQEGCTHCIVETTSEGMKQWRHVGIAYDIAIFTNLFPEHLEAHGGSFAEYRRMKGKMFRALEKYKKKSVCGKHIEKVIIANADSPEKDFFLNFRAERKLTFGISSEADFRARDIRSTEQGGTEFSVGRERYKISLSGCFNVSNALAAITASSALGIPPEAVREGLRRMEVIPGRMERIDEGQEYTVFVDYAHEKESLRSLLSTVRKLAERNGGRVLVLLGASGGGRDKAKRPAMGKVAAALADIVVVSNEDPYDEDPGEIIEDIASAAEQAGKARGENLFPILDRREGIRKILSLAKRGDVVCITGKGSEQTMIVRGGPIPWDERAVVREELRRLRKG